MTPKSLRTTLKFEMRTPNFIAVIENLYFQLISLISNIFITEKRIIDGGKRKIEHGNFLGSTLRIKSKTLSLS